MNDEDVSNRVSCRIKGAKVCLGCGDYNFRGQEDSDYCFFCTER